MNIEMYDELPIISVLLSYKKKDNVTLVSVNN
jgi:hypothetical protein